MPTTQSRYQQEIEVDAGTPVVVTLPAREGPYAITVKSGQGSVEATISSRQEVADDEALWLAWPNGTQTGPYGPEVVEDAEALKFTAAAGTAVFQIMGIRS